MDFERSWFASTEKDNKSGFAEFAVNGHNCRIKLRSFDEFQQVEAMVMLAMDKAKADAETAMRLAIREI